MYIEQHIHHLMGSQLHLPWVTMRGVPCEHCCLLYTVWRPSFMHCAGASSTNTS